MKNNQKAILSSVLEELKNLRKVSGQADFGEQMGYSNPSYLSQVMTGIKPMSRAFIDKVVDTFGVDRKFLKTGIGKPFPGESVEEVPGYTDAESMRADHEAYFKTNREIDSNFSPAQAAILRRLAQEIQEIKLKLNK